MKLRKTLAVTIVASSLLVGAKPLEHGNLERTEIPIKPLIFGAENPFGYNNPLYSLKGFKKDNTEVIQAFKQGIITPTIKEQAEPTQTVEPEVVVNAEPVVKPTPEREPEPVKDYRELTVEATAYVSYCDTGCIGITKTGTDVSTDIYHDSGLPIVAVDPEVIPLGSIVEIEGTKYIADDTGGDIKGNRIDILVAVKDTTPAFEFGRQQLNVKVYE